LVEAGKRYFVTTLDPRKLPPASPTPPPRLNLVLFAIGGLLLGIFVQEWRLGSLSPQHDDTFQLAQKAFRDGDDKVALSLFSKLADQNKPTAQYWLAHMTELGLGVPRDPAKAIELYKKAAAQNVVAAQLRLGEIYLHGDLVTPDFAQAKHYLDGAAYQGNARAAMLLGQMYRTGLGMPPNAMEAYAWSEVATIEGSAFAKAERDASLRDLSASDQQLGIARAKELLNDIKKETIAPPTPPSK
jgi:TPR repeat protein